MKTGVGLLIAAMALTPLTDGFSKELGQDQSAFFICFARYFSAGVIALAIAGVSRKPVHVPRHHWGGQMFRTGLMMGAMCALIYALSIVPLANAVGGFLIAPVVAMLISVLVHKEHIDRFRLFGTGLSFAGAFLILRPAGSLEFGTMMALLGGALLGAYLAATRQSSACGDTFSSLVIQSLLGAAMVAPLAFWNGIPELSDKNIALIVLLGAVSATCHFLTIAAYNRADAAVLAPFFYFNIIFAIPVGFFWFGEIPTVSVLAGLLAISLGGIVAMFSRGQLVVPGTCKFTIREKF